MSRPSQQQRLPPKNGSNVFSQQPTWSTWADITPRGIKQTKQQEAFKSECFKAEQIGSDLAPGGFRFQGSRRTG